MTKRTAIAAVSMVIIAISSAYYLFAVRCLGRTSHERPKLYDIARYEVYSAVLDDIGGNALLIQNDTRALVGFERTSSVVTDHSAGDGTVLAVEPRFRLSKTYGLVSSDRVAAWFRQSTVIPPSPDLAFCRDFSAYDTLVALSPVGFNSDQTSAGLNVYVMKGPCFGDVRSEIKVLRKQCGRWKIVGNRFATVQFDHY